MSNEKTIQVSTETLRKALCGINFEAYDSSGDVDGNRAECSYLETVANEIESLGWLMGSYDETSNAASPQRISDQLLALGDRIRAASVLFDQMRTDASRSVSLPVVEQKTTRNGTELRQQDGQAVAQ